MIMNTSACNQPFIQGCLAIVEGFMANPHGAEEHGQVAREPMLAQSEVETFD
jgi:hypothetical protein